MRRLALTLALALFAPSAFAADLIISEYIEGTSNNKAIELYNPTTGTVNAGAYFIRMYFNGATTFTQTSLAGSVAPGGTFVLAHGAADPAIRSNANNLSNPNASWFNGNDAVALVRADGTIVDVIGQIGFNPGTEWGLGSASTADNTLRRKSNVCVGDAIGNNAFDPSVEWDGFATNTFGGLGAHAANCNIVPPDPPVPVLEIHQIQGSGAASPYAGQKVETKDNVVTAVGTNGFFIQTPDFRADASTATSNGIFVFTGSAPTVSAGNLVDVKGNVVEFFNLTELSGSLTVTVKATFATAPLTVTIPPGFSSFEQLEGMLVRIDDGVAAAGTDQFGSTQIVAGANRPFREPGLGFDGNPEIFEVDPLTGPKPSIIGGATISAASGPLSFDFGDYVMRTTTLAFANPPFPRPVRARNAGELTVATQNMLRFFANDSRLAAFSSHIRNVLGSPDVLAVQEVDTLATLSDLAAKVNADGGLDYTAYLLEGNDIGGIDVGFLVRGSVSVSSVTQIGATDTWVAPGGSAPELLNDRPPLLLRGSFNGNGLPFPIAVIAVHQRSLIDVETSARVRAKRQEQATRLAAAVQALSDSRVVVTGDFNAFEFSDGYVDVMGILTTGAGLTNRVLGVAASDRYSYNHESNAQVLDHSLTSAGLDPFVRGFQFARANADAPASLSRVSDHDGGVLFVMSDHDADGLADDADQCPTGDARATVILGGCDSGAPNLMFPGGCSLADRIHAIHASAKNHGQFVSETGKLLSELMKDGLLTGAQRGAIESCAARMK